MTAGRMPLRRPAQRGQLTATRAKCAELAMPMSSIPDGNRRHPTPSGMPLVHGGRTCRIKAIGVRSHRARTLAKTGKNEIMELRRSQARISDMDICDEYLTFRRSLASDMSVAHARMAFQNRTAIFKINSRLADQAASIARTTDPRTHASNLAYQNISLAELTEKPFYPAYDSL